MFYRSATRRASDVLQGRRRMRTISENVFSLVLTGVMQRRCSKKESERAERETETKAITIKLNLPHFFPLVRDETGENSTHSRGG